MQCDLGKANTHLFQTSFLCIYFINIVLDSVGFFKNMLRKCNLSLGTQINKECCYLAMNVLTGKKAAILDNP